ncbi:hypothetical protein OAA_10250 [Vibrio cyclitrophicus 1F175]|uniref:hypothetical protein n=3 Tax=Vibrio cyclitrophicus TaxID=47951 RepID=UPI00030A1973|nr:hypothetical protein [Vibrio cyclitrophicus]OEF64764.1 hypothetical protein OAA_10250 [Vibrio cyclitrophicus 1F175]
MLSNLKKIYDHVPTENLKFLKNVPDLLLFGRSYLNYRDKVSFEKDVLDLNIFNVLNFCRDNTSFGSEFIPRNIYVDEAKDVLSEVPMVSSSDLSNNLNYYTSNIGKFKSYLTTTGGTGRNPTSILLSNESFGIEWVHIHHIWDIAKYCRKKDLKLTLRGKSLSGDALMKFNPIYNELVIDTFKVTVETFPRLSRMLKKYDISCIHGYPSLLKEFIRYFKMFDYRPNVKAVYLGSEGASILDKVEISNFFNAKVIHWYGQTEKVTLAVDANSSGKFKVYTSYGYPRIVDGEIVSTSFINKALPLINYRTGDAACLVEDDDCIYLSNLKGRWGKDFIYLDSDKKIPTSSINLHSKLQGEIIFYQIIQTQFGKIKINILPKHESRKNNNELVHAFYAEIKNKLSEFEIRVEIVSEEQIKKSVRGKMMMLVQELNIK